MRTPSSLSVSLPLLTIASAALVACVIDSHPDSQGATTSAQTTDDECRGDDRASDDGSSHGIDGLGGDDRHIRNLQAFANPHGAHATYSTTGSKFIDTDNPFFKSLGTNGRTCNSCHAFRNGLSIAAADVQQLFNRTCGNDPLFRGDGKVNPNADTSTFAAKKAAFALLLSKGLIRLQIPIPANAQFQLIGVDDPYNNDLSKGLVVFRRPLTATNLKFNNMIMFDGREPNLVSQARDATLTHAEATQSPSDADLNAIVAFETALFTTQVNIGHDDDDDSDQDDGREHDEHSGSTSSDGAHGDAIFLTSEPFFLDMNRGPKFPLDVLDHNVFTIYEPWAGNADAQKAAVERGEIVFNTKQMINPDTGVLMTCSNCHNAFGSGAGTHSTTKLPLGGVIASVHVSNPEFRTPDLPLYTFKNLLTGEIRQSTDPGRMLVTGKWDKTINAFKAPRLRGLAAHAPYFHNGLAATLDDVVNHYDTVFKMSMTTQEKSDLAAFLGAL